MFLLDTNVISEARKAGRANPGVRRFFLEAIKFGHGYFLSVVTVGELRRGVEMIRHRGDIPQAETLEKWLNIILTEYRGKILEFDAETAQVWGRLRIPRPENALDKQLAATALIHGLTLVTRNECDLRGCGLRLLNPFA